MLSSSVSQEDGYYYSRDDEEWYADEDWDEDDEHGGDDRYDRRGSHRHGSHCDHR